MVAKWWHIVLASRCQPRPRRAVPGAAGRSAPGHVGAEGGGERAQPPPRGRATKQKVQKVFFPTLPSKQGGEEEKQEESSSGRSGKGGRGAAHESPPQRAARAAARGGGAAGWGWDPPPVPLTPLFPHFGVAPARGEPFGVLSAPVSCSPPAREPPEHHRAHRARRHRVAPLTRGTPPCGVLGTLGDPGMAPSTSQTPPQKASWLRSPSRLPSHPQHPKCHLRGTPSPPLPPSPAPH